MSLSERIQKICEQEGVFCTVQLLKKPRLELIKLDLSIKVDNHSGN